MAHMSVNCMLISSKIVKVHEGKVADQTATQKLLAGS